ncbi:Mitotic-spindle organizing protein 1 [Friedmanniomyces simplex]|uniref:Mitotic-spindle organizing protein 1 n=1 Tax=Friedmanniomyces simplex TaxID=329884 RepID=A0A4U0X434_9PEZI|nr:Mitotic-spindle organizing protein 1 [Friedmanniomyces simplex]
MPAADDSKRKAARETIDILHEISTLLNTNLDRQSLSYCVSLIENGVNPEALAKMIKELRVQNARHEAERGAASASAA